MVTKGAEATVPFKMIDAVTYEPKPLLTVTVQISKDGGSFTTTTNSPVEIGDGWYYVVLTADETNCGELIIKATSPGALQSDGTLSPTVPTEQITSTTNNTYETNTITEYTTKMGGSSGRAAAMYSQCAWMDKDIKLVTGHFKEFDKRMDQVMADRDKIATLSMSLAMMESKFDTEVKEIKDSVAELIDSVDKLVKLTMTRATADELEGLLNGSN